jgi:long-chain acyl-CoA synthetase
MIFGVLVSWWHFVIFEISELAQDLNSEFKISTMEVTRIFDLLEQYGEKYKKEDVLAVKRNKGWDKFTADDYIRSSYLFAYGLIALGFSRGDKIATISNNRPEWNFADMGMAMTGVVHVPVFPSINEEDYLYIFNHSEVKAVIISDRSLYLKLKPFTDQVPAIKDVYTFNGIPEVKHWEEIINTGRQNEEKLRPVLEKLKREISPDDVFTMIYTSGTTGIPKGVMLSHRNIITNFIATSKLQPLDYRHKVISFLPLSHIYERMMNYHYQYKGISIYYAESLGTIIDDVKETGADGFTTVPRLLEKVFDRIMTKGKSLKGIKKFIFFRAVNLGLKFDTSNANKLWFRFRLKLADRLVFHKWREALGGNIKVIVSGGSALQPRLVRIFWAAGIPILEGYGLTETSPVIAVNNYNLENMRFGTVGPVLEGVSVKIDDDGEILCKGPNVMKGYFKDPEYTGRVIDGEGWFRTGDIGTFEEGKFLKITDRKKEIFKTTAGKYVAPQVIENKLKESLFIEQVMVIGENEKFVSAIISPNFNSTLVKRIHNIY